MPGLTSVLRHTVAKSFKFSHGQGAFRPDRFGSDGENLVLNAERNGYSSVVFNRTKAKTDEFLAGRGAGKDIVGAATLEEFVATLERPRRILMMVKAGQPVDDTIAAISPSLKRVTC